MIHASPPGLRFGCHLVVVLVAVLSWGGCAGTNSSKRVALPAPDVVSANVSSRPLSTMTLDELADVALQVQPEDGAAVGALRLAVQGREFPFFAEIMARAAREQRDRPEISGWLRVSAEWVGNGRNRADLLSLARELSHRECCTRANYVGAAIEGWVAGLSAGGGAPANSEIETRWRLRELAGHADPRIATPALAALAFFPGGDGGKESAR